MRARAALAAAVLLTTLTACADGGGAVDVAAPAPPPSELPEGDPGLTAPEAGQPSEHPEDHHADLPARTDVPVEALLDAATLAGVAGGTWQAAPVADAGPCGALPDTGAGAARTVRLADATGRALTETVLAHTPEAQQQAVEQLGASFAECGIAPTPPLPLGEHAAAGAHPDGATVLAVAAEGAVVVLVGRGGLADAAAWEGVTDVALGSACPAAPEGCH